MPHSSKHNVTTSLDRLRRHQEVLVDFARVVGEATDIHRLLDIACQHASRATGVNHVKVMQYRSDKADLLIVAGKGWHPGVVGHQRLGADMLSPPGRAFQTGEPTTIPNITKDPDFRYSEFLKGHGIVSLINAPVSVDGAVWGVIELDSVEADAFDADDERFLMSMGLTLALALRHRLVQAERDQSLQDIGKQLTQTETLMREQNHRVRNYFQMILSILASRSHRASSDELRREYREVMERVSAIGLAHDLLTVRSGQSVVDAAAYLDALCSGIERTLGELRIERDLESIELRPDRAVPLGLVVNELLTNSLKHATKGRNDVFIRVRFCSDNGRREAVLEVADNGPGMGEPRPGSMGLRLVRSLASQLSGHVEIDSSSSGTHVKMAFPLVE